MPNGRYGRDDDRSRRDRDENQNWGRPGYYDWGAPRRSYTNSIQGMNLHRREHVGPEDAVGVWSQEHDRLERGRGDRGGGRGRRAIDRIEAAELMTRDVATVHPRDSVVRAARLMRDDDVGALPVVDNLGRAVGMITDRDIACRVVAAGDEVRRSEVADAMTDDLFGCRPDWSLRECLEEMSEHQIRRLPVLDSGDRVVGIISQADILRHAERYEGGERRAAVGTVRDISEASERPYRE